MAWFSSLTEREPSRLRRRSVRAANKPSTALIQDALVGVKWTWEVNRPGFVGGSNS